ncbi:MAG: polysaccharide biosynthesis protein, partial [Pseudomonadota bacterium]
NVLDSSGSVVQLFRQQIEKGGPVTVTSPQMTRFFMSIPEAATLVIQAGAMAKGGELFVLDMGEPVRIQDLARLMISLSGYEVLDRKTGVGDIAIDIIGPRPGEKLYEELLVSDTTEPTEHPRIMRCQEPQPTAAEVNAVLDELAQSIERADPDQLKQLLRASVDEFASPDAVARADTRPPVSDVSLRESALNGQLADPH